MAGRRIAALIAVVVAVLVLSDGTAHADPVPLTGVVEAGSSDWRVVSVGGSHTCGIRTTGRLYCWGWDEYGQVGNGSDTGDQTFLVEVAGGRTDWTTVTAGGVHTCARRSTGRLYCWGSDGSGQLGNGPVTGDQTTPVEVAGGRTDWTTVTAGGVHTCARRSTGRLYCWGADYLGQVGNGEPDADQPAPVQVAGNRTDWTAVTAGFGHTCARRSTGRLYCWGDDSRGQVGNGPITGDQPTPFQVAGNRTDWTAFTAGLAHTCARRSTGRLFCWGQDVSGQLGNGPATGDQPTPVQVAGGATDWTQVDAGDRHTCARRSTGRLYCWGRDFNSQLGDGGILLDQPAPTEVAGGATDWATVDGGGSHTCARTTTKRLFCWGADGSGQLGNGPLTGDLGGPWEVPVA